MTARVWMRRVTTGVAAAALGLGLLQVSPTRAARTIISENFQDETSDALPTGTSFSRSFVPFVNPNTDPAKIVVSGGAFADPWGSGNKSLVFHNPNSAAQMSIAWTSEFDDDPAVFKNGVIEFDVWMDKPLPASGAGVKFWSFLDVRIGYGGEDRAGVSTQGDVTIWDNIRIQNVFGVPEPVESVVDAGAQFSVGLQTTYTDPQPEGLFGPDESFHVRYEVSGTPGSESYVLKISDMEITWTQDEATSHPWVPGAPGINVLAFLTDASGFFSGGASNVYMDNLVVINNDLPPLGNGDYNGDSEVDGLDFLVWQRDFGASVASGTGADGNANGMVDGGDLSLWAANFGPGVAAIPEPASGAMAAAAGACLASVMRRKQAASRG